jgi:hypothetical protein
MGLIRYKMQNINNSIHLWCIHLFILNSQLPSIKMMMMTMNNDTDDSDNNDRLSVQ